MKGNSVNISAKCEVSQAGKMSSASKCTKSQYREIRALASFVSSGVNFSQTGWIEPVSSQQRLHVCGVNKLRRCERVCIKASRARYFHSVSSRMESPIGVMTNSYVTNEFKCCCRHKNSSSLVRVLCLGIWPSKFRSSFTHDIVPRQYTV
jgi:hypothetical protein